MPAQKRPPAFTPEERAKRRQQIKERLSKQVSELQKKKASGSINDEERQRLDRLEVLAGRFRNQGFNPSGAAGVTNATYTPDEYKFEMLSSDVVAMTHRGTAKGMKEGKEVTESHRSLHIFQKNGGKWQVVANAQLPPLVHR